MKGQIKSEALAKSINNMPNTLKKGIKLATYTIDFNRVGFACYYDDCVEARSLKTQLETAFASNKTLRNTFFAISFTSDSLQPIFKSISSGSWWRRLFGTADQCENYYALQKSI